MSGATAPCGVVKAMNFESPGLGIALVVLVALPCLWLLARDHSQGVASFKALRRAADECLRSTKKLATGGEPYFDDASVRIMSTDELATVRGSEVSGYTRTYIVRDQAGDYFMFMYRTDNAPYLKRVSDEIARELGDKYIAPLPRFRGPHDKA